MILEGTDPKAITRDQAQEVIDAVVALRGTSKVSLGSLGRAIGYGGSTISQVLNWQYKGDWQNVILDLDRWQDEEKRRAASAVTADFVWTKVALEIKSAADVVTKIKRIGVVYGPTTSGIGKTMALKAVAAEKPGTVFVTIEKATANASGLLRAIAAALRIHGSIAVPMLFERIKSVFVGTPRLLIIDQVHNLCGCKDDKPFFMLADLFDATGAPQLWCGTTDIVAYLDRNKARGRETLAQVSRRVPLRWDLMQRTRGRNGGPGEPLFTIEEIRKVFAKNRMRLAPDAARYLCMLANLEDAGAIGSAYNLVMMATIINEARADVLTGEMLRSAHRMLVNCRAFDVLEARLEEEQRPMPSLKVG